MCIYTYISADTLGGLAGVCCYSPLPVSSPKTPTTAPDPTTPHVRPSASRPPETSGFVYDIPLK